MKQCSENPPQINTENYPCWGLITLWSRSKFQPISQRLQNKEKSPIEAAQPWLTSNLLFVAQCSKFTLRESDKDRAHHKLKMVLFCASLNLFTPLIRCQTVSRLTTVHRLNLTISSVRSVRRSWLHVGVMCFFHLGLPHLRRTNTTSLARTFGLGLNGSCCRCCHLLTSLTAAKDWNLLSVSRPNLGTLYIDNSEQNWNKDTERERGGVEGRRNKGQKTKKVIRNRFLNINTNQLTGAETGN